MVLLLITFILASLCFGYAYFKSRRQLQQLIAEKDANESKLQKLNYSKEYLEKELSVVKKKLNHMNEDPLTNVLGWSLFTDRLVTSINESSRYQLIMSVIYIDIKDFNVINAALGYEVGDAILQEVAKRLQLCIRKIDSLSRFSKDIFVILLNRLSKPETAAIVAQRILQSLEQPIEVKEQTLAISVCIGISIFPSDGQDAASLFRNAEQALQTAKKKGSHNFQFYQEKLHTDSQRELALSMGLKRESIAQEFAIYYQPIMNVKNNAIFCMEALLHWRHPELGLISPEELLSYAEKHGKLNAISEWLLKTACQQFLAWRKEGFHLELLGVPLSIRQLESSHFIYRVSQILQELNFNPSWLMLEIKENTRDISFDVIEKAYNMLKYLNIKLAIENFGSHSLSICELKNFAVDYLKLDGALISDVEYNHNTRELIKAIQTMVNSLSMQLILQNVESEQQMTALKALGCQLMQGQWIGAPFPESDAPKQTQIER